MLWVNYQAQEQTMEEVSVVHEDCAVHPFYGQAQGQGPPAVIT